MLMLLRTSKPSKDKTYGSAPASKKATRAEEEGYVSSDEDEKASKRDSP